LPACCQDRGRADGRLITRLRHLRAVCGFKALAEFEEEFEDSGDVNDSITRADTVCFQGEVNFGNPDQLITSCRKDKLAYNVCWAAKCGAFGSGMIYWFPDMKEPVEVDADEDCRAVITIRDLQGELKEGKTLAEVVARFDRGDHKKIPPLELKPPKRKKPVKSIALKKRRAK